MSTWKKSHASIVDACERRNCRHVELERRGAGGIRSRFRIRRTVEAPTSASSARQARAMMHSARDLQTRLRIDLAIPIGSAIEPGPHAHVQVTADRRPGAGPGLL